MENRLSEITEPITILIEKVREGDNSARDRLWQIFLPILKQKADAELRGNNVGAVMNPSDLVQDAAMILVRHESIGWNDRVHLYAFAATVMRHIIIDRARKYFGGDKMPLPLDNIEIHQTKFDPTVLEIDELLNQLAEIDRLKARVMELRYFGGLTVDEIAQVTGLSPTTVKRYTTFARAFILSRLGVATSSDEC
ncbi:MAG: sigma-70 family RNA polymerase sigma factor [Acidobacteria bacterium]|nr:sigma-70 family RNA polymerase sigma factor [Acidobacteriota bacterium]